MSDIINFLESNKEWLFDGLGVAIAFSLVGCLVWIARTAFNLFRKRNNTEPKQIQITGDNCSNIQSGDSITFNNSNFGGKGNVK